MDQHTPLSIWYAMTDQLPTEPGDYVLLWSDQRTETFEFSEGDLIDLKNDGGMNLYNHTLAVTHWLKIPERPHV